MSVNSSSPNVSILLPLSSSNSSLLPLTPTGFFSFIAFTVTNILLLPLYIWILYLGLQRWRQRRSVSAVTSHSDHFTYHMVTMELIGVLGSILQCCGLYMNLLEMMMVGIYAFVINLPGQILFHCLTCGERYLAVMHPIIYLGLRNRGGVRVRNISIGCVWLLCFAWGCFAVLVSANTATMTFFCLLTFSLLVVSFGSLSVLCTLIRPGPGEVGGDRERVDQSKQRAFYTIMAILGVLLVKFVGLLVCRALSTSKVLSDEDGCLVAISGYWFGLPSSLVLPLLFLHRAGKLAYYCKCTMVNQKEEQDK